MQLYGNAKLRRNREIPEAKQLSDFIDFGHAIFTF